MEELTTIYDMVYDTNCNIIDVRNALAAVLYLIPDNRERENYQVYSLVKLAAAELERVERSLDNAGDYISATQKKIDATRAPLKAASL